MGVETRKKNLNMQKINKTLSEIDDIEMDKFDDDGIYSTIEDEISNIEYLIMKEEEKDGESHLNTNFFS